MAPRQISPQQLQEIREFAATWGKIISRRAFGDAGPDASVDFQTMEQVAAAAAAGLTEGTLSLLLEQQAHTLAPQHPCPACGCLCPVTHAQRTLTVPHLQVGYDEPLCHCPSCRRDFFPPPHCSET
jgi:hypothetical protein